MFYLDRRFIWGLWSCGSHHSCWTRIPPTRSARIHLYIPTLLHFPTIINIHPFENYLLNKWREEKDGIKGKNECKKEGDFHSSGWDLIQWREYSIGFGVSALWLLIVSSDNHLRSLSVFIHKMGVIITVSWRLWWGINENVYKAPNILPFSSPIKGGQVQYTLHTSPIFK